MENTGMDTNGISDVLGLVTCAPAINSGVKTISATVEVILDALCRPLLEELGLWGRDHIRQWRLKNICRMIEKSNGRFVFRDDKIQLINPRVAFSIAENASIVDDDELLDMWAGLFSSSVTEDGLDDSNLIYSEILKKITKRQAQILKFACEKSEKVKLKSLIMGCKFIVNISDPIFENNDIDQIDRDLDCLKALGLITTALKTSNPGIADLHVTTLGLWLYAKCQGHKGALSEFYTNFLTEDEYNNRKDLQPTTLLAL